MVALFHHTISSAGRTKLNSNFLTSANNRHFILQRQRVVRPLVKERCGVVKKTVDGLYDIELIPDACTRAT